MKHFLNFLRFCLILRVPPLIFTERDYKKVSLFLPTWIRYHRLRKLIRKVDQAENLVYNLSNLYGNQFREDWVGRWYTVLNPLVKDMKSLDGVPFEYTADGISNQTYIEKWCMDRMFAASNFIKNKELLDVMTYKLERLDDHENYLFVLQPILFDDLKSSFKRFSIISGALLLAFIIFCAVVL